MQTPHFLLPKIQKYAPVNAPRKCKEDGTMMVSVTLPHSAAVFFVIGGYEV